MRVPLKVDTANKAKFVVNGTAVEDPTIDAIKGTKLGRIRLIIIQVVTFTPNKNFVRRRCSG